METLKKACQMFFFDKKKKRLAIISYNVRRRCDEHGTHLEYTL